MADTVIEPNPAGALPPVSVAALLESAMRARKSGNLAASRALLRALATQQPDLPQVWLMLATVAETRAEQRHALEQVLAFNPRSEPAQRGLARIGAIEAASAARPAATIGQPPDQGVAALPAGDSSDTAAPAIAQPAATVLATKLATAPASFAPGEYVEPTRAAPGLRPAEQLRYGPRPPPPWRYWARRHKRSRPRSIPRSRHRPRQRETQLRCLLWSI